MGERLERAKTVRAPEYVYCHTHTEIHENSLDPYCEGYETCYGGQYGVTAGDVHRAVYYRLRKGDYWVEEPTED